MLVSNYSVFGEAKKILSIANLKEKIRERYYAREDAKREKISWENMKKRMIEKTLKDGIEQGWQQGIEQGMQQGIEQGIAQGRLESAISTLNRYIRRKLPIDAQVLADIAEDNKLTIEKVRSIAKDNGISLSC